MAKLMFRFVGEAKSGPIEARLLRHEITKDIISLDLPPGEAVEVKLAYPSEVIFVTGMDELGRTDYGPFAKTRRRDLVSKKRSSIVPRADSSTMVTDFDFKTGLRTTRMLGSPTRRTIVGQEELGVAELNPPGPDGISITDNFSLALAKASGVPCWGSPLGAGACYAHARLASRAWLDKAHSVS